MTATKIQPGDDTHLTLLMAPHSLNFVTGADRAALLVYGRDVFAAGQAGAAPAAVAGQVLDVRAIAAAVCQRVAELPDRDSPADWPEAMLVTGQELIDVVTCELEQAQAAPALEAPASPPVPVDEFRGDTPSLVRNIVALLELDADGALVPHGVGGHARGLLSAAAARLAAAPQAPAAPSDAQLLSEWDRVSGITKATERRLACMRAVLKRWGSAAPAAPAVDASDTARMNWLEAQVVNVRAPLRYGSRDLFWASPEEVDGGPDGPSDLRARIDAAQAAAKGASDA